MTSNSQIKYNAVEPIKIAKLKTAIEDAASVIGFTSLEELCSALALIINESFEDEDDTI